MKYIDFYKKFHSHPIINLIDVKNIEPNFDHRRLYEWQKKGYLKRVINNFYIFTDKKITEHELSFIANILYEPSYISLEYALNYYGLIPETVYLYTSISTKKTNKINSHIGNFNYYTIKKELFFGYKLIKNDKFSYKIAEPEKALLDFLYLRSDIQNIDDIHELRINKERFKSLISKKRINNFLKNFSSKKLEKKVKLLYDEFN